MTSKTYKTVIQIEIVMRRTVPSAARLARLAEQRLYDALAGVNRITSNLDVVEAKVISENARADEGKGD